MKRFLKWVGLVLCMGCLFGCDDSHATRRGDGYVESYSIICWDMQTDHDLNYYFVRVNDLSTNAGVNPGADIDAIQITKAKTGERAFVSRVEEYVPVNDADISDVSILPDNILGAPTAFGTPFDPAEAGSDKTCSLDDEHFVSLGGVGGYIIVSFGDAHVENGDAVTVYEIGNCNGEGVSDPVEVQVSVSSNVDGEWITVFSATEGPVMSGEVEDLPLSPNPYIVEETNCMKIGLEAR